MGKVYECSGCTFSAGGMQLHGKDAMTEDTDLRICLSISGKDTPYMLHGAVRWCHEQADGKHRMGVEFKESYGGIDAWREFINEHVADC